MVYDAGWTHPQDYKGWYDVMAVGASPNFLLRIFRGINIEPRMQRLVQSIQVMHETGHSLNFRPIPGHNTLSYYPWQLGWWLSRPYKSCMNYGYMYTTVDYSDGSRPVGDYDDWERMDLTYFERSLN